jgi:hypothetical protein
MNFLTSVLFNDAVCLVLKRYDGLMAVIVCEACPMPDSKKIKKSGIFYDFFLLSS